MNRCSPVCRDLPLFLGGDLDLARSAEVSRHLRECSPCRREAMRLQQSLKQLQRIALPIVHESVFAEMQATIVARVDAEIAAGHAEPRVPVGWQLGWAGAAAAALFVIGWWFVRPPLAPAALERSPIAVPIGHSDPRLVQPYAGTGVPLRFLGDDVVSGERGAGFGPAPGMMGRWRLRALVDEEFFAPWPGTDREGAPMPGSGARGRAGPK